MLINKKKFKKFLWINLVLFLMPIGDIFYLIPSKITSGGLYGLAIVLMHGLGIEHLGERAVSVIAFALTSPLLLYSYFYFSAKYFKTTFYATVALPVYMFLMGSILDFIGYRVVEQSLFLATILGSVIQGVGIGVLMGLGGSTGGTDIIAKIINKYFSLISLGIGVSLTNFVIIVISSLMFGVERGLASVFSIILTGWVIDLTIWLFFDIND